jgi:hypothetical protein
MAASLTYGQYNSPVTVEPCQSVWIIVSTWGDDGDYLSLSLTHAAARRLGPAPRGLQPAATYLGLLLVRNARPDQEESVYLLLRHCPADVAVGGIFHPSDGYVRVRRQNTALRLVAHGRYAHCHGTDQGQSIVRDIPDPPPGYQNARSWHLTAAQRPWIGQFPPHRSVTTTPSARAPS